MTIKTFEQWIIEKEGKSIDGVLYGLRIHEAMQEYVKQSSTYLNYVAAYCEKIATPEMVKWSKFPSTIAAGVERLPPGAVQVYEDNFPRRSEP